MKTTAYVARESTMTPKIPTTATTVCAAVVTMTQPTTQPTTTTPT